MILNAPLAMICGIALAFDIIGCIKILWHLDKYMSSKENVNQWIQEEEIEVADPNHWLEQGDVEWNPINRQMNHQIENCDGSGDK